MEVITNLVRDIAVIVILASFMEMLLPNSNMKRFVQVILGLFILITILNPIVNFLNEDLSTHVNAWQFQANPGELEEIMAQGMSLAQTSDDNALRQYEQRLEQQISGLVTLIPEVDNVKVKVDAGGNITKGFGNIESIYVLVAEEEISGSNASHEEIVIDIEPIRIELEEDKKQNDLSSIESTGDRRQGAIAKEIKDLIGNFYGIANHKIFVEFD